MSSAHIEESEYSPNHDVRRLRTHDMEMGVTDAVQRHVKRHVITPRPVSQRRLDFEHARWRWLREMAAEAMGVFFYVLVIQMFHQTQRQVIDSLSVIPALPHKHHFS
jgi:hypothetical protein